LKKYKLTTRLYLNTECLRHAPRESKNAFAGRYQDFRYQRAALLFAVHSLEIDLTALDISATENVNRAEL